MTLGVVSIVGVVVGVSTSIDPWDGARGSRVALALGWNEPQVLRHSGRLAIEDEDFGRAIPYLEEAADRGHQFALVELPWVLAAAGRCDEATAACDALIGDGGEHASMDLADIWIELCAGT